MIVAVKKIMLEIRLSYALRFQKVSVGIQKHVHVTTKYSVLLDLPVNKENASIYVKLLNVVHEPLVMKVAAYVHKVTLEILITYVKVVFYNNTVQAMLTVLIPKYVSNSEKELENVLMLAVKSSVVQTHYALVKTIDLPAYAHLATMEILLTYHLDANLKNELIRKRNVMTTVTALLVPYVQ